MTAPTVAVEWLLARAAVRSTGLLHIVSERDSGALNPMCAANPIRSEVIERHHELNDLSMLCPGCADLAESIGGTVRDGVALMLGLSSAPTVARLLELPISEIRLSDAHPRLEPGEVDALVASVIERGIVTPVLVRRVDAEFEVIDGGRRVLAAVRAGRATVPAIVRTATNSDALLEALVTNLHRADLNPIDEARAYQHALDTIEDLKHNKAELGRRLGISREKVSNAIRLLSLTEEEQALIAAGALTAEGGRKLLAKPRPEPASRPDVAGLLAQLLAAKVRVTAIGGRTRIVIDVADDDADRILGRLGETAAAA